MIDLYYITVWASMTDFQPQERCGDGSLKLCMPDEFIGSVGACWLIIVPFTVVYFILFYCKTFHIVSETEVKTKNSFLIHAAMFATQFTNAKTLFPKLSKTHLVSAESVSGVLSSNRQRGKA